MWYNSSFTQFLSLNPNELLYWKLIEFASSEGYRFIDFGPTSLNPLDSHYKFKSKFGGRLIKFNDYTFYRHKLRCLVIEKYLLRSAKILGLRKKIPRVIINKVGSKKIL